MIFASANFSRKDALLASFGCGALNWLGALPAVFTIDRFGRRKLLLVTLPFLSICLFWAGSNFSVTDQRLKNDLLMASIYIFMFAYSPGLGPVPFTYAAEAFPLHIRAQGMASATSITWALNFVISFSWPQMMNTFTVRGGFYFYATWNIIGFIFAYFFVPETKNRTLEELDVVFSVRNRDHAAYQVMKLKRGIKKLAGKKVDPVPELYKIQTPTSSDSAELVQGVVEPKGNDAV
jgi:MFS family permease